MTRAKTKWVNNFLIASSFSDKLAEALLCDAKQAYLLRDKARLKSIGEKLINLSPRYEYIGRLYVARSAPTERWTKGCEVLSNELESLINDSPFSVRIAALNALCAFKIQSNKMDGALLRVLSEVSALSLKSDNVFNFIQAQSQLSLLCSINGSHQESLEILRGLKPIINYLGSSYEIIRSDFHNSVAYELAQLGNREAAKYFASFVAHSPHLNLYPEWQENLSQIFVKKASRSFVVVKKSNVLQFPVRKPAIETGELIYRFKSKEYRLRDLQLDRLTDLCNWVDASTQAQPLENNAK